jgi:AbrB family looped-hinge helix DNA binding protein
MTRTETVRIDAAGRLVVPKAIRDELGLTTPGAVEIDIEADGATLRPRRPRGELCDEEGLLVVSVGRPVTDDEVLAAIRADRDARG